MMMLKCKCNIFKLFQLIRCPFRLCTVLTALPNFVQEIQREKLIVCYRGSPDASCYVLFVISSHKKTLSAVALHFKPLEIE